MMVGMDNSPHTGPVDGAFLDDVMRCCRRQVDQAELNKRVALAKRDEDLRKAHASGWKIIDIAKHTGLSVSAVRMAVYPDVRDRARKAKMNARAAARPARPSLRERETMPGTEDASTQGKPDESGI